MPSWFTLVTCFYGAILFVVLKFQVWRPEFRRVGWGRRQRVGRFLALGVLLIAAWVWILFTTRAPATGDPRFRGGLSPAQQKDLTE